MCALLGDIAATVSSSLTAKRLIPCPMPCIARSRGFVTHVRAAGTSLALLYLTSVIRADGLAAVKSVNTHGLKDLKPCCGTQYPCSVLDFHG